MAESVTSVSTNRNLQCEVDSFHFLSAWSCVVILALLRYLKRWEMGQRENIRASTRMCKFHSSYVWNAIKALHNCLKANNAECCNGDCSVLSTTLTKLFKTFKRSKNSFGEIHLSRAWLGVSRSVPLFSLGHLCYFYKNLIVFITDFY